MHTPHWAYVKALQAHIHPGKAKDLHTYTTMQKGRACRHTFHLAKVEELHAQTSPGKSEGFACTDLIWQSLMTCRCRRHSYPICSPEPGSQILKPYATCHALRAQMPDKDVSGIVLWSPNTQHRGQEWARVCMYRGGSQIMWPIMWSQIMSQL